LAKPIFFLYKKVKKLRSSYLGHPRHFAYFKSNCRFRLLWSAFDTLSSLFLIRPG